MKKPNYIKIAIFIYVFAIFYGVFGSFFYESIETSLPVSQKIIVIDAGHGGWDPGKVRSDGTKEKDVNLMIAEKLQKYLEQGGAYVINTRIDDSALSENKRQDLKERKELANSGDVDIFISIHQNSFPKSSVKGAQVFYFKNSELSKALAEAIQERIKEFADKNNSRVAKSNSEYYLLKQSDITSVIVECGFLSNDEENKKLNDEEYQQKLAWAIYMGVVDYCKLENAEKT